MLTKIFKARDECYKEQGEYPNIIYVNKKNIKEAYRLAIVYEYKCCGVVIGCLRTMTDKDIMPTKVSKEALVAEKELIDKVLKEIQGEKG